MDFTNSTLSNIGRLHPNDLKFFYYDVARFSELEQFVAYTDDDIIKIARDFGISLKPLEQKSFSSKKYELMENEIYFVNIKNKENKYSYQVALLKHLRNSFSHYRITYAKRDSFLLMEDTLGKRKYTMRGLVEIEKLKKLIFRLKEYSDNELYNG